MKIIKLHDSNRTIWDNFVKKSPNGLPQHLSGWQDVLSKTYGYKTHYLMASDNAHVVGIMPLFIVDSYLMGCTAMTMPGALCAESSDIATRLINDAMAIAEDSGAKSLALQDTRQKWAGDIYTTNSHEYHVVRLSENNDENWKTLHRETRRQIRNAKKNGITVKMDREGTHLSDFHNVFGRFVHKEGIPVFGKNFLKQIINSFQDKFSLALVYVDNTLAGAYFQLMMGETVFGLWGATLPEYQSQHTSYLAYWKILADSANQGYRFWDMGRSLMGSNVSKFKKKWSGVSNPVYQQVISLHKGESSESVVNRVRSEDKYKRFMTVWSKLPFPFAQFFGPWLRRHIPFG